MLMGHLASAQIFEPMHWSWKAERVSGDTFDLKFTCKIDSPWHSYSVTTVDSIPYPTTISILSNTDIELIEKPIESGPNWKFIGDPILGKTKFYTKRAVFTQRIKVKKSTIVKGDIEAIAADASRCLAPLMTDFNITIDPTKKVKIVLEN